MVAWPSVVDGEPVGARLAGHACRASRSPSKRHRDELLDDPAPDRRLAEHEQAVGVGLDGEGAEASQVHGRESRRAPLRSEADGWRRERPVLALVLVRTTTLLRARARSSIWRSSSVTSAMLEVAVGCPTPSPPPPRRPAPTNRCSFPTSSMILETPRRPAVGRLPVEAVARSHQLDDRVDALCHPASPSVRRTSWLAFTPSSRSERPWSTGGMRRPGLPLRREADGQVAQRDGDGLLGRRHWYDGGPDDLDVGEAGQRSRRTWCGSRCGRGARRGRSARRRRRTRPAGCARG